MIDSESGFGSGAASDQRQQPRPRDFYPGEARWQILAPPVFRLVRSQTYVPAPDFDLAVPHLPVTLCPRAHLVQTILFHWSTTIPTTVWCHLPR